MSEAGVQSNGLPLWYDFKYVLLLLLFTYLRFVVFLEMFRDLFLL